MKVVVLQLKNFNANHKNIIFYYFLNFIVLPPIDYSDNSEYFQDSPTHPAGEHERSDRSLLAVPYSPFGAISRIRLGTRRPSTDHTKLDCPI